VRVMVVALPTFTLHPVVRLYLLPQQIAMTTGHLSPNAMLELTLPHQV